MLLNGTKFSHRPTTVGPITNLGLLQNPKYNMCLTINWPKWVHVTFLLYSIWFDIWILVLKVLNFRPILIFPTNFKNDLMNHKFLKECNFLSLARIKKNSTNFDPYMTSCVQPMWITGLVYNYNWDDVVSML